MCVHRYMHTCMRACIHTCTPACMHTYITYMQLNEQPNTLPFFQQTYQPYFMLYYAILYCTILSYAILQGAMRYYTILYSTFICYANYAQVS